MPMRNFETEENKKDQVVRSGIFKIWMPILVLVSLIWPPAYALAWDCMDPPGTPEDKFTKSEIVFEGTVFWSSCYLGNIPMLSQWLPSEAIGIRSYQRVLMRVTQSWKAVTLSPVMLTNFLGCDEGDEFQVGETLIIYGSIGNDGKLGTSVCTGNVLSQDKTEDVIFLNTLPELSIFRIEDMFIILLVISGLVGSGIGIRLWQLRRDIDIPNDDQNHL